MPTVPLVFNKGIFPPIDLGSIKLKPAPEGYMGHGQNVDVDNDEFGEGIVLPGPALNTITNNSELTGAPFAAAQFSSDSSINLEYLFLAEGILGVTNKIRVISGVKSGGTPQISTSFNKTITHNDNAGVDTGHTGIVIEDIMEFTDNGGNWVILIAGRDNTDHFLLKLPVNGGGSFGTLREVTVPSTRAGHTLKQIVGDDGKVYVSRGTSPAILLSIDNALSTVTTGAFNCPQGIAITALGKFQTLLAIGYCTLPDGDFAVRNAGGESGIILWNYASTTQYEVRKKSPSNYISVIIQDPAGNTLCFGGLDQGKTTLYEFTGLGFVPLTSYIGDMPRSRHNVDFDVMGRIYWQTVDGEVLRYDRVRDRLSHLGTMPVGSSAGGILRKLVASAGNDFILGSGSGSNYYAKKLAFGNYVGDGAGADTVNTPVVASGLITIPQNSIIDEVSLNFHKNFASGEKVEVRIYKGGDTGSYTTLGSIDFSTDGAISGKIFRKILHKITNCVVALAWKNSDNITTAPGFVSGYLHHRPVRN